MKISCLIFLWSHDLMTWSITIKKVHQKWSWKFNSKYFFMKNRFGTVSCRPSNGTKRKICSRIKLCVIWSSTQLYSRPLPLHPSLRLSCSTRFRNIVMRIWTSSRLSARLFCCCTKVCLISVNFLAILNRNMSNLVNFNLLKQYYLERMKISWLNFYEATIWWPDQR